jgi:hypothetical protein
VDGRLPAPEQLVFRVEPKWWEIDHGAGSSSIMVRGKS